jgi:ATP:ADP antiporter, AAA family
MPRRRAQTMLIDRAMRPFASVKAGEGKRAGLLTACIFLLFMAYYALKTAREGLILVGDTYGLSGDQVRTYATGAMAVLLIVLVPAYDALVTGMRRLRLINLSYAIVLASLVVFVVLGRAGASIGVPFFVWFGLVSAYLVAQFWSYATDLYDEEQGSRLFAIIATGGSLGAIVGPRLARLTSTFDLMLVAGIVLIGCVALFNIVERGLQGRTETSRGRRPIGGPSGVSLVMHDRGLALIALMLLVANLVNTTGEYILANAARSHAMEVAAHPVAQRELIKVFYSDFYSWVNGLGFLVQAFAVSRVIKYIGVQRALFILPVLAFGAYAAIAFVGGLAVIRAAKIAENATDYSLQNTVRQALFLPAERAVKYKAKAAIDTLFVRVGDLLSAILVGIGLHTLNLGPRDLALICVGLVALWLVTAAALAHHDFGFGRRRRRDAVTAVTAT